MEMSRHGGTALTPLTPAITLQGCGAVTSAGAFTYTGDKEGFKPLELSAADQVLKPSIPPYSITVLELTTGGPAKQ